MNVNISFDTNNAAFEESFLMAITKTLQQAKSALLDSDNTTTITRTLVDGNGNRIGTVSIGQYGLEYRQ
jgi:hypothetical protein